MKVKRIILMLLSACALGALVFAAGTVFADSQSVVFVSSKGKDSNSGLDASAPVKTLDAAYRKIGGDGTVVVCAPFSINFTDEAKLPKNAGKVTITSVYDGVDYRSTASAKLALGCDMYINGDTVFENIDIEQTSSPKIICQGNNVRFGEGINTSASGRAPVILGGTYLTDNSITVKNSQFFDYTIQIDSGTWYYVNAGCLRTGEDDKMGVCGDVRLIINGGKFTATGSGSSSSDVCAGVGFAGLFGDLYIEINGGEFNSSFYAIGRPGMNGSRRIAGHQGNVEMVVNGGEFKGIEICALQEPTNFLDGDFSLTVNSAKFSSFLSAISAAGVDGTAYIDAPSALEPYLNGFSKNVYVSSNGSDDAAGTKEAPLKTLGAAADLLSECGGRIILQNAVKVTDTEFSDIGGDVVITGKLGAQDYSGKAKLELDGKLTLGSDTRIEYLSVSAKTGSEICAGGHDLVIGAEIESYSAPDKKLVGGDVKVDGPLIVSGGDAQEKHTITLNSGTYLTVRGGMSEEGTAVVINGGRYTGSIYGAGPVKTKGTASVLINGGHIEADVWASEKGSTDSVGVSVTGGAVYVETIGAARKNSVGGEFDVGIWGGTYYKMPSIDTTGAERVVASCAPSYAGALRDLSAVQTVFVADGGEGDGSSPLAPSASLSDAAKLLGDEGGRIVVMGEYTLDGVTSVSSKGKVVLTSLGGGCDYSVSSGARIVMSDGLSLRADTLVDHIEFFAAENNTYVAAHSNSVEFGEHVRCTVFEGRGVEYPISVYGGIYATGTGYGGNKSTDVTIRSGNYYMVLGGNYRTSGNSNSLITINGNITLNIYGGRFEKMVALNGNNDLVGDAVLNIWGGEFMCPVFALANNSPSITAGNGTVRGDVTVNIWGGTFAGNLDASKDNKYNFDGTYTLNVYGGNFDRVASIKGTSGIAGNCTSVINTNLDLHFDDAVSGEIEFTNPVAGYADPSVIYADDGFYYYSYAGTYNGKQAIYMTRAANLCDVGRSDPYLVWTSAMDGKGTDINSIWAPQLYKLDGKWYMYATCAKDSADSAKRLPYVWVGGESPTDPYTFYGVIDNYEEEVEIYLSPRIIDYGSQRYLVCGGFHRASDRNGHQQKLFVTKMSSPTSFEGRSTVIATPTTDFEDHKILEGPFPLISPNGTLYLAYAAGHTRGQEYCTGVLKFKGDENDRLNDPSKWEKMPEPIHFVDYSTRVYSPGAMVFTTSPDGSQIWAVYHAKKYTNTAYTMRRLYIQPLEWVDDYPTIEDPRPVDTVFTISANPMTVSSRISGFTSSGNVEYTPPADAPYDAEFDDVEPFVDSYSESSSLSLGIIIGAVAALLAAAAATLFFVFKKKKATA